MVTTMDPAPECLFHDDRTVFENIEKELVASKCLPKSCAHRLASAVCSCRKKKGEIPDRASLLAACDIVSEEIIRRGLHERWSPFLRNLISSCLEAKEENNYSHCKFLLVISKAVKGDFSPLTREAINTNKEYINKEKSSEKNKKMTETQKRLMENKRKKKMMSETINVPMFPGNFRTFESCFLGKTLDIYAKENTCYIQLVRHLNDSSMANNVNKTFINIWSKDSDRLKTVRDHLAQKARETQAREDSQRQIRRAKKEQRKEEKLMRPKIEQDEQVMEDNLFLQKDWKGENLERKLKKKSGSRNRMAGLLPGGHCLQCKKLFSTLDTNTICVHHPGYTVKQLHCHSCGVPEMMVDGVVSPCPHPVTMTTVWSCCGQPMEGQGHDEHILNGCCEVRHHNWRVNYSKSQRSSGCHGNKIPGTPCKYVRKRATKHRHFERKQKHVLSFKLL